MKKFLVLALSIIAVFVFSACDNNSPYSQYTDAYQRIWEADSFITAIVETDSQATTMPDDTVEINTSRAEMTTQLVNGKEGYITISDTTIATDGEDSISFKTYYRDGWLYSQDNNNPENNFRQRQDDEFASKIAIEGVIEFPKDTIAKQAAEDTAEGTLLTFELDSAKYYEYLYPSIDDDYKYGEFSYYREPPLYTVLLDEQGRIKQVTGHFCTVNSDWQAFTWERDYTVTFTQYGGVQFAFPELSDEDFPLYPDSFM